MTASPLPLADVPIPGVQPRTKRATHDTRVLYGVIGLLMFTPLAFGGRAPWSLYILQAGSAVLLAAWTIAHIRSNEFTIRRSPLFWPALAFAGLISLQLIPGISAYWHATYSQLLQFVAYGCICFLISQTLTHTRHLRIIAKALAIFGSAVALFAMLQSLSSPGRIYWWRAPFDGGWTYGPYVNHNHYAGLMEMLIPVPLVFAFSQFARRRERWIAASIAAFMGATIFLSGSRGGMLAFAAQIALFALFIFREHRKQSVAVLFTAFVLITVGVVAWTGAHEVGSRLATLSSDPRAELSTDIRLQIDRDILTMVRQRPLLGWGQGTFADVYPRFRSFYTDSAVNAAHNDLLQVLAETGFIGFAIMIWFLIRALRPAWRKSQKWQSSINGAVSVAAILGISGILVHSLFDFNMQIPANAALFYSLCTVAAMEPRFTARRHRKHEFEISADSAQTLTA